ncbi:MAG: CheR family methyltransferase [Treponemataceae bacterium]
MDAIENVEKPVDEKQMERIQNTDFKMVSFSLNNEDFAIDIMKVKEIVKTGYFTFVPNTSPFVLGVYNLRGDIIPIIDFRAFFNLPVSERDGNKIDNMIILQVQDQTVGVVVDAIDKVVGIQSSTIQAPHPFFTHINIQYIRGIIENKDRLHILLDIDIIFSSKLISGEISKVEEKSTPTKQRWCDFQESPKENNATTSDFNKAEEIDGNANFLPTGQDNIEIPLSANNNESPQKIETPIEIKNSEPQPLDYNDIILPLSNHAKFVVSKSNISWVNHRLKDWTITNGNKIESALDAQSFLDSFFSKNTGTFWSKDYADSVAKAMPNLNTNQITVWNPGCGKGFETYSLAVILKKCYPNSRIRIYAQDIDLLNISGAPTICVSSDQENEWFAENLVATVSGEKTFSSEIKDMILFEYHDCLNVNNMPSVDIIFCRDVVSFLEESAQLALFNDFYEKLKTDGILIIGENETPMVDNVWMEYLFNDVIVYKK